MGQTVLFINWTTRGRDVEIDLPLMYFFEKVFGWRVEHASMFNLPRILSLKPDIVLMPNTTGGVRQVEISELVEQSGFPLFSHVSEGMFREENLDEFIWGAGCNKKRLCENLSMYWSDRCVKLAVSRYPELKNKILCSGAVGVDKYQFKESSKIQIPGYQRYIGFAAFDYHNIIQKKERFINENGIVAFNRLLRNLEKTNEILKNIIETNKDICFFLKSHPGDGEGKISLEFEGLEKYKNTLFVDKKASIFDVIASSDIWLSFNSSTNLEAWLLEKPTISLLTDPGFFSSEIIHGAVNCNNPSVINNYIKEFYLTNKIQDFEKKNKFRESMVHDYIGFDDGMNHVRYVKFVKDYLDNVQKLSKIPRWKVSLPLRVKAYLQHFLYSLSKGQYSLPVLYKWAEYYDVYDYNELDNKKALWYQDLEKFHQSNRKEIENILNCDPING